MDGSDVRNLLISDLYEGEALFAKNSGLNNFRFCEVAGFALTSLRNSSDFVDMTSVAPRGCDTVEYDPPQEPVDHLKNIYWYPVYQNSGGSSGALGFHTRVGAYVILRTINPNNNLSTLEVLGVPKPQQLGGSHQMSQIELIEDIDLWDVNYINDINGNFELVLAHGQNGLEFYTLPPIQ